MAMSLSGFPERLRQRSSHRRVPAITVAPSPSPQPRRFPFLSGREVRCFLLCFLGGLTTGYSQAFLGCLIPMDKFIYFLSSELYRKSQTTRTSNFCPYLDVWSFAYYVPLPIGVISGFFSGSKWSHSGPGRRHPRASIMAGAIVVSISALVFTFVKNIKASAAICFVMGVGVGLTREAIPVITLQVAPGRRTLMDLTFEFSKALGELLCFGVCSFVVEYFPQYWGIVVYVLAVISLLLLFASILIGEIGEVRHIEYRSMGDLRRQQPRLLRKKLIRVAFPQILGVSSRLFHGPFLLESLQLWVANPYAAVLIGSAISFVSTALVMYYLIPTFERKKVIVVSLVCTLVCEIGSLIIFLKWGTEDHVLKGKPLHVLIAFFVLICFLSPMFAGPHGWSADDYPRDVERAGRAMESVVSTGVSLVSQLVIPTTICRGEKLYFMISSVVTVSNVVFALLMV